MPIAEYLSTLKSMHEDGGHGPASDAPRRLPCEAGLRDVPLFVIERVGVGNERQYWACSSEHGSGWHPGYPKQAFSRSELTKEIRRLIDQGWFTDCVIRQLFVRN